MTRNLIHFVNCQVFCIEGIDGNPFLRNGNVLVDETKGLILSVAIADKEGTLACSSLSSNDDDDDNIKTIFNCHGHILAPGFIDLQLNGAFGIDFSSPDLTDTQVELVAKQLPRYGVTSFCPTLISCKPSLYKRNIPLIGKQKTCLEETNNEGKAKILGLHLEGPFFQPSQRGAHPLDCIVNNIDDDDDDDECEQILDDIYGCHNIQNYTCIVTLAPELNGAAKLIETLVGKYKIIVSMGHSSSTLEQGLEAVQKGATCLTHLYNAMTQIHHRRPGLIGLLCCDTKIHYGIIVDGIHVHPTAVKMAFEMNPKGAMLVTDAMAALGLEEGSQTTLGSQSITVRDGKSIVTGTKDTLAGSNVSMDTCVKNFHDFTSCTKAQAIACATFRPAQLLRNDNHNIGQIKVNFKADLVLLNSKNLEVLGTWINGRLHHTSNEATSFLS